MAALLHIDFGIPKDNFAKVKDRVHHVVLCFSLDFDSQELLEFSNHHQVSS